MTLTIVDYWNGGPALKTLEVAKPGQAYTLFESGPGLELHAITPSADGRGAGPTLCGFDRFAPDEHGRRSGFSVGGGTSGPNVTHDLCARCAEAASIHELPISGSLAREFVALAEAMLRERTA